MREIDDAQRRCYMSVFIAIFPVFLALMVFFQTKDFGMIGYDDPVHLYENVKVQRGFSYEGLKWCFTQTADTNLWHPVTWMSYMLDVELFGIDNVAAHHLVNVGFHCIAVVLLYFLVLHYTGNPWLAGLLCCLWAIHPHRAHNVAWISERKDVLCMSFTLGAWLAWVKSNRSFKQPLFYVSLALFLLAMLSKPSAVGLPLVLLVSEVFFRKGSLKSCYLKLAIFFTLSGITAVLAIYFQKQGALADLDAVMPLGDRLMNMPYTLWWYIESSVYSNGSLWVYPPSDIWQQYIKPCMGLLALATVIFYFRKSDLVKFGAVVLVCFWLPVSGLMSVSFYQVAERYSYFIQLGMIFLVAGVLIECSSILRSRRAIQVAVVVAFLLSIGVSYISYKRTSRWRDNKSLFSYEVEVNPRSLLAYIFLGIEEKNVANWEKAIEYFQQGLALDQESGLAARHMADCYVELKQAEQAEIYYRKAMDAKVLHNTQPFQNLFLLLLHHKKNDQAEEALLAGLKRFPNDVSIHMDLGVFYLKQKQDYQRAQHHFEAVLRSEPSLREARLGLGWALVYSGEVEAGEKILNTLKQ